MLKDATPRNTVAGYYVYIKNKDLSWYYQSRGTLIPCLPCLAQVTWI